MPPLNFGRNTLKCWSTQRRPVSSTQIPSQPLLSKRHLLLEKQIRAEIAEREAELAEEDDFDEWIKGVEKRREAYLREIEEAKRISETHRKNLERFKRKLQQLGLWDYKADKPKTTQ